MGEEEFVALAAFGHAVRVGGEDGEEDGLFVVAELPGGADEAAKLVIETAGGGLPLAVEEDEEVRGCGGVGGGGGRTLTCAEEGCQGAAVITSTAGFGFEDEAGEAGVEGELGHSAAFWGQRSAGVDGAEAVEEETGGFQGSRGRGLEPR